MDVNEQRAVQIYAIIKVKTSECQSNDNEMHVNELTDLVKTIKSHRDTDEYPDEELWGQLDKKIDDLIDGLLNGTIKINESGKTKLMEERAKLKNSRGLNDIFEIIQSCYRVFNENTRY